MPYVYILRCRDGTFYTGSTWNLDRRIWEHQNGLGANYTQERLPVTLAYCEECERVEDAFRREKQIQGWSHRKKLALIERRADQLPQLATNYHSRRQTSSASTGSATGISTGSMAGDSTGSAAGDSTSSATGGQPVTHG